MKEHGGNIYRASRETGIPERDIIDFSASVNPLGVPETAANAIRENIENLPNYPEPFAEELGKELGTRLGIDPGMIFCGNGSTELIYLAARALSPGKVLLPSPTFSEYERACEVLPGMRYVRYLLRRDNNFDIDPDEFIDAMEGCDMAFLCNPNNPTGRLVEKDALLGIAKAAELCHCHLVVDEAFIEFIPENSIISEVEKNLSLIVLRSFTKFYALSGLRIGYGVFPPGLAERVKRFKEPWTVNTLAQTVGIAVINDKAYEAESFEIIRQEKRFLEKKLSGLGIEYVPSVANYYLLRIDNARRVIASLREKGILVRDCANFEGSWRYRR
ncbi:MAG: threonine-phosphate decarboxylase CobD, partial [Nitrospirae bacterium]|nr:threonine-phosphate decarboxylase CobD [Nitrospirota bacterium]